MKPIHCGNCDWTGDLDGEDYIGLDKIVELAERMQPGAEVPAGACPECGALLWVGIKDEFCLLKDDVPDGDQGKYVAIHHCREGPYVYGLISEKKPEEIDPREVAKSLGVEALWRPEDGDTMDIYYADSLRFRDID